MGYIKKLPLFFFVLVVLWYGGLFVYFNREIISVEIPYLGIFQVSSALSFLSSFIGGAVFAAIFFAYDSLKKYFSLRKSQKQLASLQKETETKAYPDLKVSEDQDLGSEDLKLPKVHKVD